MPMLQELDSTQVALVVREAAERNVPLAVCARRDDRWVNLHSRFVAVKDDRILIEIPAGEDGSCPYEFSPAEKIGLNFKLKHHKYICTATAAGVTGFALNDGTEMPVLGICWPAHMHRLQRRAYLRVDVPPNRIVRASFWLGGLEAEPAGGSAIVPVWPGAVTNISAGGLQLRATAEAGGALDVGDVVGMRLLFALGSESVYADAQFRHKEDATGEVLMGFQFLGLGQTRQSQQALKLISAKVAEFQRPVGHRADRREQE